VAKRKVVKLREDVKALYCHAEQCKRQFTIHRFSAIVIDHALYAQLQELHRTHGMSMAKQVRDFLSREVPRMLDAIRKAKAS